jgi:hypothetical protein
VWICTSTPPCKDNDDEDDNNNNNNNNNVILTSLYQFTEDSGLLGCDTQ